jgi:oligopeptide transport system ATP-binding protein
MDVAAQPIAFVSGLSVIYRQSGGQSISALNQANLSIAPGQRVGILGESGSGKSTLALAFMRLLPADAQSIGKVRFKEHDLFALSDPALRRIRGAGIALIPQDPEQALNPVISVGDQIAEVLRSHFQASRRERRGRVEELLSEVGFDHPRQIYGAYPHELSGGQRQRIVIAQAVACRPQLVIADEPTSKLDASLKAEILALMLQISRQHHTAFILITHDPTTLAGFAERIAVMYAGQIVEDGPAEDIFRNPLHPYTQALIGLSGRYLTSAPLRTRLPVIEGEPPTFIKPEKGCPFASRCPERMQTCVESDPQQVVPHPSHRVSCFLYE